MHMKNASRASSRRSRRPIMHSPVMHDDVVSSFLTASLHFRRVSRQGLHFPDLPPPFKHFPFTPSYEPVARGIFQASDSSVLKPLENCTT